MPLDPKRPVVESDGDGFRVDGERRIEDDLAVNLDPAGSDQVGRFAARGRAGGGDEL